MRNGKREKIGKTMNQNNAKANDASGVKSCFRRERPESDPSWVVLGIAGIITILLYPFALLFNCLVFFLRMRSKFTGKEREK